MSWISRKMSTTSCGGQCLPNSTRNKILPVPAGYLVYFAKQISGGENRPSPYSLPWMWKSIHRFTPARRPIYPFTAYGEFPPLMCFVYEKSNNLYAHGAGFISIFQLCSLALYDGLVMAIPLSHLRTSPEQSSPCISRWYWLELSKMPWPQLRQGSYQ